MALIPENNFFTISYKLLGNNIVLCLSIYTFYFDRFPVDLILQSFTNHLRMPSLYRGWKGFPNFSSTFIGVPRYFFLFSCPSTFSGELFDCYSQFEP